MQITEFIRKNFIFLLFIILGLILCLAGGVEYFALSQNSQAVTFTSAGSISPTPASKSKVMIDVSGKVLKPGVYSFDEGARLQDALIAAGGVSSSADRSYVSKRLNLAQKITDGAKLYIPAIGETEDEAVLTSNTFVNDMGIDIPSNVNDSININSASFETLDTLPKIGPITAQKIINGRPYGTIDELVSKSILTQKTLDGIRDKIVAE